MTTDSLFPSSPPRRWGVGLCVGLLAVALVLTGCDSDDSGMDDPPEPAPTTLADVVTDADNLSTLATALGAANRADALDDTSATYTVFAPANPAFDFYDVDFLTSNTDLLGSVLDYHVVQGAAVTSDQLSDGDTFTTLQGDEIEVTIEDGNVFVEGAQVTTPDVDEAENGVAHIVDDVLLTNRTAGERLQVTNATESLFQAVSDAGLASAFNNPDNVWTTFAPNNQAFENADLSLFTDEEIGQILQYHTLDGATDSEALLQALSDNGGEVSLPTNQGEEVTITEQEDGSIVFNGGEAALNLDRVDQRASNGVIHPIDGVLTPPSIQATLADLVANTETLSTLATALGATGQDQALDNPDETYTVFAPANPAFGPYDVDFLVNNTQLLGDVLGYHVVQGAAVTSDQLSDGDTFTTLQGEDIEVTIDGEGNIFVEGAPVTTADLEVDNGVAHVVGDVLLTNRSPLERLQVNTATQTLRQQLENAGLASTFDSSVWTTFAPSNTAFENADLSGFSDSEIQEILQYHTLDGATDSEALLQLLSDNGGEVSVTTNQGEDLTITQVEPDSIVFNNGQAALNLNRIDQRAGNGSIIHQIDGVLIPPSVMQSVSYDLEAQSNDGAIPGGVSGTVTFWDAGQGQTIVTLELDDEALDSDGSTGANVAHPAHIHENSASEGGGISIYLTPIDGRGGNGTSARLVERPFDELAGFDGYVNIHESVANLGTIVAQGNIGANAQGTPAASLDLVGNQRSETYSLDANNNDGSVAPNGIPGSVTFLELTGGLTFVQVSLDTGNGATGADVGHPAHIHNNSASEGGGIQYYLSPVDGSDAQARSGKLVGESYDALTGFDGYVNVHESVSNLGDIVSQGNVGSNAP
ncbi:MAG: fasciclin domain-containing protein [Salinivenus sp.]